MAVVQDRGDLEQSPHEGPRSTALARPLRGADARGAGGALAGELDAGFGAEVQERPTLVVVADAAKHSQPSRDGSAFASERPAADRVQLWQRDRRDQRSQELG